MASDKGVIAAEKQGKETALENAIRQIEKDHGKGSIMKLGEAAAKMNVEVIPTGVLSLDVALGVGGIPRGRVIEIYGPIFRENHGCPAHDRSGAESRRSCCLH